MRRIHASLCWSDLPHLTVQARLLLEAGADALHLDVVETPHLPTLTRAPALVQALSHACRQAAAQGLPARGGIELHLMGVPDMALAHACVAAGAGALVFHAESARHAVPVWRLLRREGCRAGLALHPASSIDTLGGALGSIDQVLMMLTPLDEPPRPGWLARALPRIELVRRLIDAAGGGVRVQAEGGIESADVERLARAGVDDFVIAHVVEDVVASRRLFESLRGGA